MLDYLSLLKENNRNVNAQLIKEINSFEAKYWRRPETDDEKLMVFASAYKKLIGAQAKSYVTKAKRALLIDVFHTRKHKELITLAQSRVAKELRSHDPISMQDPLPQDCKEVLCVDGKYYRMEDIDFNALTKAIHTLAFLSLSNLTERLSKNSIEEVCKQHLLFTMNLEKSNHHEKAFSMEDGSIRMIPVMEYESIEHLAIALIRHHLLELEAKLSNTNLEDLKSSLQQQSGEEE